MFRISRFHELLQPLSRGQFDRLVQQKQANKHSKGFGCWDQLVAMLYAQLSGASSLRQLEAGFNSQSAHHYHLGVGAMRRSTLADANARRSSEVFAITAQTLMAQAGRKLRREAGELLYLLDSTSITLKGPGFDAWTTSNRTRHTQGIKLHMLYESNRQIPQDYSFTAANINDVSEGVKLPLKSEARYVFDKGYCDYNWWASFDAQGAFFVTRFKSNASLRVESELKIEPSAAKIILRDEIVCFSNRKPRGGKCNTYTQPLRRVVVARPDQDSPLTLATNDLHSPAVEIAQQYKARWQVELYFKWIKQHLRIRQFLGRSENAVRIQILTALIAYLLLSLWHQSSGCGQSLWTLLGELRSTLFQRTGNEIEWYRKRRQRQQAEDALQMRLFG